MGKVDKIQKRFLSQPKDFTWKELQKLLAGLEYVESQSGKTSGSRVKFLHEKYAPILLHKPHPTPALKHYQVKQILETLKNRGQL